ncbi:MAG: tetratricopeptide repeat protein [Planctomycetota bacterium]
MSDERAWKISRRRLILAAAVTLLSGGALFWLLTGLTAPALPAGITADQYKRAAADWKGLFRTRPTHADTLMLLAETSLKRKQLPAAVACFTAIESSHPRYGQSARLQEAQVFLKLNQAAAAERSFRTFLSLAAAGPGDTDPEQLAAARRWLAWLMAVQLRFEDRVEWLDQLLQAGQADVYDAKQRFFPTLLIWASSLGSTRLREFVEEDPHNLVLRIAAARYETADGRPDAAVTALRRIHQQHPENLQVLAALLEAHFELHQLDEFSALNAAAPPFQPAEPWLLTRMRAEAAMHQQRWTDAEKLFRSVLDHDPANPACTMGLAASLAGQGRTVERETVQNRSLVLSRIRVQLSEVRPDAPAAARRLADEARSLGMIAAADALLKLAENMPLQEPEL